MIAFLKSTNVILKASKDGSINAEEGGSIQHGKRSKITNAYWTEKKGNERKERNRHESEEQPLVNKTGIPKDRGGNHQNGKDNKQQRRT